MAKILAFAGSNSSSSINHKFLESVIPFMQAEVELISLRDYEAPLFGVDLKNEIGVPDSIRALHAKMFEADGLLVSAAEHNGSMTAVLKNTFDWLSMIESKFFLNKPTVFLSTSPGARGAASAMKHLLDIMPFRGAVIVGSYSLPSFNENFVDGKMNPKVLDEVIPIIRKLEEIKIDSYEAG